MKTMNDYNSSYKEVFIAVIDDALDYLSNNKK